LGAVVTVHAGDTSWTKVYDGVSGYLSHSLYPLYFGLADAQSIDRVEVAWPSGIRQVVADAIEMNSTLLIDETE
jgi:hypothetical protein